MADTLQTDVVVVGAGPAGSIAAIGLARRGIDTVIIEKESFPRFHIGESLVGETGAVLRSLGLEDRMDQIGHPVKRGTKIYGPRGKNSFWIPVVALTEDGDRHDSTTWQVRRADFDTMLLDAAAESGATRISGEATSVIVSDEGQVGGVAIQDADGVEREIHSKVVVDASGMKCFLSRAGLTGEKERGLYDTQIAIFTHVSGAKRDPGDERDNTIIFYQKANHWAWFIPVDDETVSVGVVVPAAYFRERGESKRDFLSREMVELNDELTARVDGAEMVMEPRAASNYSYQIRDFTGPGFVCVGDSHRFIDPVFSFGVHFAVAEGTKVAEVISDHLAEGAPEGVNPFEEFERYAEAGQDVIQELLDAFWLEPFGFAYSAHQIHRDEIIDFFAGRVYDVPDGTPGLVAIKKLAAKGRARVTKVESAVGS